jgi:methyl-accepting chemotaxis protein/methyl-accepting chemotaxis protein-1 (serine sensor receptor)
MAIALLLLVLAIGGITVWMVGQINVRLREIAAVLAAEADQAAVSASQVASTSQLLAQGASDQAACIEGTSASSLELDAKLRKNAQDCNMAVDLAGDSQARLRHANRALDNMLTAMNGVKAASESISEIIQVIDGIAFQTNILALNAAVEAARAGEAGMGFGVVADEVRTLAQRSAQAARDTSTLIENSIEKSREGKSRVEEIVLEVRAVVEESGRIKALVDDIHRGSEQQSDRIEQLGEAIKQVGSVTQQFAASAEESAASAEELSTQAGTLQHTAGQFALMVGGVKALAGAKLQR